MGTHYTESPTWIGGTYCNNPNKERLLLKEDSFLPPVYIILPYIHNIWLDKVLSGIRGKGKSKMMRFSRVVLSKHHSLKLTPNRISWSL